MKRYLFLILAASFACVASSFAYAESGKFSFAVIAHTFGKTPDEMVLRNAIAETDAENLAFVVANGIKSSTEPCTDQLYARRKQLLEKAQNGLILSLASSDWAECRRRDGRSAAIERLNRVRDLFFVDEFSFGSARIPVIRQSLAPQFRSYGENTRWSMNDVLFATINLPANNNHYLSAAGRNSEFEDRLVANQAWLKQLFNTATRKRLKAIVIFSDANPLHKSTRSSLFSRNKRRDGFTEIRRQLIALAANFKGKVLVVHNHAKHDTSESRKIAWQDNLGHIDIGTGWTKITVDPSLPALFSVAYNSAVAKNPHPNGSKTGAGE